MGGQSLSSRAPLKTTLSPSSPPFPSSARPSHSFTVYLRTVVKTSGNVRRDRQPRQKSCLSFRPGNTRLATLPLQMPKQLIMLGQAVSVQEHATSSTLSPSRQSSLLLGFPSAPPSGPLTVSTAWPIHPLSASLYSSQDDLTSLLASSARRPVTTIDDCTQRIAPSQSQQSSIVQASLHQHSHPLR